jgi:hypothetical protein
VPGHCEELLHSTQTPEPLQNVPPLSVHGEFNGRIWSGCAVVASVDRALIEVVGDVGIVDVFDVLPAVTGDGVVITGNFDRSRFRQVMVDPWIRRCTSASGSRCPRPGTVTHRRTTLGTARPKRTPLQQSESAVRASLWTDSMTADRFLRWHAAAVGVDRQDWPQPHVPCAPIDS